MKCEEIHSFAKKNEDEESKIQSRIYEPLPRHE